MKKIISLTGGLLISLTALASETPPLLDVELQHDTATLRQGADVVLNVCAGCHSLHYLKYRDLLEVGFTQAEVDGLRGQLEVTATIAAMSPPDMLKETYGVVPPDLSLIAKARKGGGRYVYTLFNSFYQRPDGTVDNHLFPNIRMPDVLGVASMTDPAQKKEFQESMRKVAAFLEWAADPNAAERRGMGVYVLIYLFIITLLFWLMKRRIWSDVH